MRSRRIGGAGATLWQASLDETTSLSPGRTGLRLTCRTGSFLVTQEHDPLDHPLEAGESFETARRGKVVAWALRPGALEIRPRGHDVPLSDEERSTIPGPVSTEPAS